MRIRLLTNAVGNNIDYRSGEVRDIGSDAADDLVNAGFAIPEGPSPSGTIADLYEGAGYMPLTPAPSGYIGPDGWIDDAPAEGGFYFTDPYVLKIVFPGRRETTFDLVKLRP